MALCRAITAEKAMEYYFENDPITNNEFDNKNTFWFGVAAEELGLNGGVANKELSELLSGKFKDETLVEGVNGHRAGIDFTFCAPKGVSLLCFHYGDREIERLHTQAVQDTLKYMQENLIEYRYTKNGQTYKVKSDNMAAAAFTHSTSRDNDPHLHTHVVLLNITNTPNGYRAISNESLYASQKLLTAIYHNYLAGYLIDKGYAVEALNSGYRVVGVDDKAVQIFSKRSKAISEQAEELKEKHPALSEAEIRDIANYETRKAKKKITDLELFNDWEKQFSGKDVYHAPEIKPRAVISDSEIIDRAISFLSKHEAAFMRRDIQTALLVQNVGKIKADKCELIIENALKENKIVEITDGYYSTPEMVKLETNIVENVKAGINNFQPYLTSKDAAKALVRYAELTDGQKKLNEHILTSGDKINIIQGDAGTGKTYAVKCLREILSENKPNIEILGLGFTGKAAHELGTAAGIETKTIAGFLSSDTDKIENGLLIVDEASMVSNEDMQALFRKAKNNKIVFIGDAKQIKAIGAGRMFKNLQDLNAVKIVKMEENMRQQTEHTKAIVKAVKDYQEGINENGTSQALHILQERKSLIECQSIKESRKLTLEYYKQNDDTLILTKTREEKKRLNEYIRNNLLSQKQIDEQVKLKVKEQVIKSSFSSGYEIGDEIVSGNHKKSGVITAIDKLNNKLIVKTKKGKAEIDPLLDELSAYRIKELNFTKGDKITFLKNNYDLKVQNGLTGIIKNIDKDGNISVGNGDKQYDFNVMQYPFIEHGYAQTIIKSQGQTCKQAILVSNSCTTEDFYVASSRAKEEFKVITSDITAFSDSIKKEQHKTSSLENVSKAKHVKSSDREKQIEYSR